MPRHNRRAPEQPARPIRSMTPAQRASLAAFAREHLVSHNEAVAAWRALDAARDLDPSLCVTGSEHPATRIRLVSAGDHYDSLAIRLATSDTPGNLAT